MRSEFTKTDMGDVLTIYFEKSLEPNLLPEISKLVARRYVEEHYGELVAALNFKAVTNTMIVEIAKQANKELMKEDE